MTRRVSKTLCVPVNDIPVPQFDTAQFTSPRR
jgi:hypothetical protein